MKLEIKIKNIETGEETTHSVGLIWGLGAYEIFEDRTGIDKDRMHLGFLSGDQKIMTNLVYAAIQNWCETLTDPVEVPFSYRQFQSWLSDAPQEAAADIIRDYEKSTLYGKTMEEYYLSILEKLSDSNKAEDKPKKKTRSVKS